MASTQRTRDQLIAEYPDNISRLITAGDGRDLILSSFGIFVAGPPNALCDRVDTIAIGSFFDSGSKWVDLAATRYYVCIAGAPAAAVWQALMHDGQLAGGDLQGTYPAPTLIASGVVPGTYGDGTHVCQVTVDANGRVTNAANIPITSSAPPFHGAKVLPDGTQSLSVNAHHTLNWAWVGNPLYDTDSFFSFANPSRLTVPTTGYYRISVTAIFNFASTIWVMTRFMVNGSAGFTDNQENVQNQIFSLLVSAMNNFVARNEVTLHLTAGDYVEVDIVQQQTPAASVTVQLSGSTWNGVSQFEIRYLGS